MMHATHLNKDQNDYQPSVKIIILEHARNRLGFVCHLLVLRPTLVAGVFVLRWYLGMEQNMQVAEVNENLLVQFFISTKPFPWW